MNDEAPIACSLDGEDYQRRLYVVKEIGRRALLAADVRPDGAILTFHDSAEVVEALGAIVRDETECCPFLDLEVDASQGVVSLAIHAPSEAMPIVRDLVQNFQGGGDE